MDASPQPARRPTRSGNPRIKQVAKLGGIVGCGPGGVFVDLRPQHFCRIKFRSSSRKLVDMKTRMACDEIVDLSAAMDRMLIHQQDDRATTEIQ